MFRPHEYAWKNAIFCKPSRVKQLWQRTFEDGENAKIPKMAGRSIYQCPGLRRVSLIIPLVAS